MADQEEPGLDPGFGVRALGYSRRQVDEFVAEVRRELRGWHPDLSEPSRSPESVRVLGEPEPVFPEPVPSQVSRMLRLAQEEADTRIAEARRRAEKTLRSAREVADRLMADARERSAELEERVSAALDREVAARVEELVRTHDRLIAGLAAMRDSLGEALDRDAMLGPVRPLSMAELAKDGAEQRVRVYVPRPAERADWSAG
jgi:cell division septum initiation protein DivIVA